MDLVPEYISTLPELNRDNATKAWNDYAEVVVCATAKKWLPHRIAMHQSI